MGLDESIARIHGMLERITACGVPSHRVVLGGFCQGAVVALLAGLSYQHQVAGICAVSGWIPGKWFKQMRHMDTPILICHGDKDAMVPLDLSWRCAKDLESMGFSSVRYVEYNGLGHQFVPDEWEEIVS